jgi:hypothetical protein
MELSTLPFTSGVYLPFLQLSRQLIPTPYFREGEEPENRQSWHYLFDLLLRGQGTSRVPNSSTEVNMTSSAVAPFVLDDMSIGCGPAGLRVGDILVKFANSTDKHFLRPDGEGYRLVGPLIRPSRDHKTLYKHCGLLGAHGAARRRRREILVDCCAEFAKGDGMRRLVHEKRSRVAEEVEFTIWYRMLQSNTDRLKGRQLGNYMSSCDRTNVEDQ